MSPPRAILLRGAAAASPTYFTLLPESFAELLSKARTLFPAPHASPSASAAARAEPEAHLTLGDDASAILCADALPALRERELLVLRWLVPAASPAAAPAADAVPAASPSPALKSSLRVRWDASIPPPAQQAAASTEAAPTSVAQLRQAAGTKARLRAEHARRVLEEQRMQRIREAELQAGDGEASAPATAVQLSDEVDMDVTPSTSDAAPAPQADDAAMESTADVAAPETSAAAAQSAAPLPLSPTSSPNVSPVVAQEPASPAKPASAAPSPVRASPSTAPPAEQQPASASATLEPAQLSEEGSSPPPYSSPRVLVPVVANSDSQEVDADAQPGSSPPTSPTRNVQSAQLKPLASSALELGATTRSGDASDRMSMAYRSMTAVLEALRHHPGNLYFRHALPDSFVLFSQKHCGQHVDFTVLASRITARAYHDAAAAAPSASASDVAEARAALMRFKSDLAQLWRNAAAFFGSKSKEAACADTLRRFAEIVFEEWSRRLGAQPPAPGASRKEAEKPSAVRREDDAQRTPQAQRFFRALSGVGPSGARVPPTGPAQRSFSAPKRLPQQPPPHPRKRLGPPLALHAQAPSSAAGKRGEPTAEQYAAFLSAVSAPSTRAPAPRGLDLPARDDASRMGSADVRTPTYESVLEVPQLPPQQPKPQQVQAQEKQPAQQQAEVTEQAQLAPKSAPVPASRKRRALRSKGRHASSASRSLAVALGNSSAEEDEESSQSANELSPVSRSGSRRTSPSLALAAPAAPRRVSPRRADVDMTTESDEDGTFSRRVSYDDDDDASSVERLIFGLAAPASPTQPSTPRRKRKARTSLGAGAYTEPSSSDIDADSLSEAEPEPERADVHEAQHSAEEAEERPRPGRPVKRFRSKLAALAAASAPATQAQVPLKRSARMIARRQRAERA